jgi:hypothetical protein
LIPLEQQSQINVRVGLPHSKQLCPILGVEDAFGLNCKEILISTSSVEIKVWCISSTGSWFSAVGTEEFNVSELSIFIHKSNARFKFELGLDLLFKF